MRSPTPILLCLALHPSLRGAAAFSPSSSPPPRTTRPPLVIDHSSSSSALWSSSSSSGCGGGNGNDRHDPLMSSEWETSRFSNMYRRFDHDEWVGHRASDRFYREVMRFSDSAVVRNLLDEAAILATICLLLIGWNEAVVDGYADFDEVRHAAPLAGVVPSFMEVKLALPTEPFFLCGGPLGLLLVFRNDVSFGRYKQAIHQWEVVIATLTNLLIMASNIRPDDEGGVRDLSRASRALARTLQHEVSGKFDTRERYEDDLRRIYSDGVNGDGENGEGEEGVVGAMRAERVLGSRNELFRTIYDAHAAVESISSESDGVSNLDHRTMVNSVNAVATACAECERLYSTPIPLLYTRHALAFLSLWMTFLPLALYDVFASSWNHAMLVPAMAVLCFLFFGIEEIAVSLEEPFGILPLGEFVMEYERNAEDVLNWMTEEEDKSVSLDGGGVKIKTAGEGEGSRVPL